MSDPLDLDALAEVAGKAMPGNWTARKMTPWAGELSGKRPAGVVTDATADEIKAVNPDSPYGAPFVAGEILDDATAEHIATFDPPTVLTLLAALKEAQEQLAELFESVADYDNARSGQPGVDWTHIQRVAEAVRAINRSEAP